MTIRDAIRAAVARARAAGALREGDPWKSVLDEVAAGLTDESVKAEFRGGPAGKWTLWLAPTYRPGRSHAMLSLVVAGGAARLLLDSEVHAASPQELTARLTDFVTSASFLESLDELHRLATEPIEAFLRLIPRTLSRGDLMVEISPAAQRSLVERMGEDVSVLVKPSSMPGAGKFDGSTTYRVLESDGVAVAVQRLVTQDKGELLVVGRVGVLEDNADYQMRVFRSLNSGPKVHFISDASTRAAGVPFDVQYGAQRYRADMLALFDRIVTEATGGDEFAFWPLMTVCRKLRLATWEMLTQWKDCPWSREQWQDVAERFAELEQKHGESVHRFWDDGGDVAVYGQSGKEIGTALYVPPGRSNGSSEWGTGLLLFVAPDALELGVRYKLRLPNRHVAFVAESTAGGGAFVIRFR